MQILLVVFNQLFRMVLENLLSQHGLNVRAVRTPDQAVDLLDDDGEPMPIPTKS